MQLECYVKAAERETDGDLVALTGVTHVSGARLHQGGIGGAGSHDGLRFRAHLVEQGVDKVRVEPITEAHIAAARDLVGDRRTQESECGTYTGAGGNEDATDAEFVGEPRGVERCRAAERDQRARLQILAALDGMHAGRICHVLFDDLADPESRFKPPQAERLADRLVDRGDGTRTVELDAAPGKIVRVETAEHDICVGDRGLASAAAIAGGPRLRARTFRSDIDAREAVDRRDRSPAGTDLHHFDHGNAQRQAAALEEAILARDLEGARMLRLSIVNQTDLRGGTPHVEGQNLAECVLAAPGLPRGWHRPLGRTRRGGSEICARYRAWSVRRPT